MFERARKKEKIEGLLKQRVYDFEGNEIQQREEFNGKESGSNHTK